jgi:hypothetical protein
MCNLIVQVFWRMLRILISLPLTLRLTTHLTRYRSRWLMTSTYFREISRHTLNWWVRWSSIRVLVPLIPNMRLLMRRHMIPSARPPECPRRKHLPTQGTYNPRHEIRPRDTYNTSLVRRIFRRRWCIFFISETIVCILFYLRDCTLFFIFMI